MSTVLVAQAIKDISNAGKSIVGPCGAFGIANLVAYRAGLGILYKPRPSENNCVINGTGYAADIVMDRNGNIWDILYDGGGANTPTWNAKEPVDASWYREPLKNYPINFNINDTSDPPVPIIPPDAQEPPNNIPTESLDWLVRQLHLKADGNGQKSDDVLILVREMLLVVDELKLEVAEIKSRQNRAYTGAFGVRLRLVPDNE